MGKELQPMDISSPGQNLESYLNSIQNISIFDSRRGEKTCRGALL
jgi:hypothetical protein